MSPEVLEDLAWSAYEKLNERDVEGSAACLHPRFALLEASSGGRLAGVAGWRLLAQRCLAAFPDLKVERLATVARGDTVALELVARGTHTGPLAAGGGAVPPTGRRVELRFCDVRRVADGAVAESRIYSGAASLLRELGLATGREAGAVPDGAAENRARALGWFAALSRGDLDVLDEVFAPEAVLRPIGVAAGAGGTEALRVVLEALRFAFPDLRFAVEAAVAEGDTVVVRWTAEGTQHGPLLGRLPTDRRARWTGMTWLRFAGGRVVEEWTDTDLLGMFQQLGILAGESATTD